MGGYLFVVFILMGAQFLFIYIYLHSKCAQFKQTESVMEGVVGDRVALVMGVGGNPH